MYKSFTIIFALGLLISVPFVQAQAASGRIGVVDVQGVLAKSAAGKAVQAELQAYGKKEQATLEQKQAALKKEHDTLQKNASIQTKAAQQKAMGKFQSEVQAFQKDAQKREQAFTKKRQQMLQPLQAKLYDVIQNYAVRHGYDMILDKNAAIYNNSSLDVTSAVLKAFNAAEAKSKK
ncbi:MAG: OmpH family outer membrane protein [Gammaproteobacteria bacterium]